MERKQPVKLLGCMRTTVAILAFGIMLSLLTEGHSNVICFDMESQSVIRCNGTIWNLYITNKDNNDYVDFSVLPHKESIKIFSLKRINENYSIETNASINSQNFKLCPEAEYEIINHSNGDSADGKLIIRTDKNNSVIYADKTSCK